MKSRQWGDAVVLAVFSGSLFTNAGWAAWLWTSLAALAAGVVATAIALWIRGD